jgi:peptidoglycan/xylan/chitin deacetylase (PgdA/CDA1 family)
MTTVNRQGNLRAPGRLGTRMRAQVAPAMKSALLRLGGYAAVRRLAPSRSVAILRYHAICGEAGYSYATPGICISPRAFESHVRYLASNYAVLPLPAVVEHLRAKRPLPRNAVAITFDDGYADNLEAARTLARHGLTATFYLTAGCLADGEPFWPAEVRMLMRGVRGPVLRLRVDTSTAEIALDGADGFESAIRRMTRLVKANPIPIREAIREQLRMAAGRPRLPRVMLRWNEVAEIRRLGMTIGSHTMTHPNLPSAGLAAATHEIVESKARLEGEIGETVTMFSYPNGGAERYETPELRRVVAESGYMAATTSRNGHVVPGSDRYALQRVQVQERVEDLAFALEVERFVLRPTGPAEPLSTAAEKL